MCEICIKGKLKLKSLINELKIIHKDCPSCSIVDSTHTLPCADCILTIAPKEKCCHPTHKHDQNYQIRGKQVYIDPTCTAENNIGMDKIKLLKEMREEVSWYYFHRNNNNWQWSQYQEQSKNLEEGEIMVVMDYKSNIKLGDALESGSSVFRNPNTRTCLGVVVLHPTNDGVKAINFCVISDYAEHNSYFVRKSLEKITLHQKWKDLNVRTVNIWSDGGTDIHIYFKFSSRLILI